MPTPTGEELFDEVILDRALATLVPTEPPAWDPAPSPPRTAAAQYEDAPPTARSSRRWATAGIDHDEAVLFVAENAAPAAREEAAAPALDAKHPTSRRAAKR